MNEHYRGKSPEFGRIDIQKRETYFDIDAKAAQQMHAGITEQHFEGRSIEVSIL